ncbi:MAG: hypothetical protein GY862_15610 [Gammaproteobacteria bacterium]|nr:hypothetical protein [Gammaproteobacteria bacterium]
MQSFADILKALSQQGVYYILAGGLAVELCGYSRVTHNVDILVKYSPDNLDKLLRCLLSFGEGSARELSLEDFELEEGCIRVVEDFPLNIFTLMSGHSYRDLLPHVAKHSLDDVEIPYVSASGLIMLKQHSLRPKDQLDVQVLKNLCDSKTLEKT